MSAITPLPTGTEAGALMTTEGTTVIGTARNPDRPPPETLIVTLSVRV
jgi:hypothetical protein